MKARAVVVGQEASEYEVHPVVKVAGGWCDVCKLGIAGRLTVRKTELHQGRLLYTVCCPSCLNEIAVDHAP